MAATTTTTDEPDKEGASANTRQQRSRAHSDRAAAETAGAGENAAEKTGEARSGEVTRAVAPTAAASTAGSAAVECDALPTTEAAPGATGSTALRTMSRMIYVSSYAVAYGIVYAAVFVAQSLPRENPVMQGFRDGGQAAVDGLTKAERSAERVSAGEPIADAPAEQPA